MRQLPAINSIFPEREAAVINAANSFGLHLLRALQQCGSQGYFAQDLLKDINSLPALQITSSEVGQIVEAVIIEFSRHPGFDIKNIQE